MSNNERTVMFQLPSVLAGQLACVAGSVAGRSWELSAGTFIIGRRDGSDLHLNNEPGVSKVHAKIVAEGDQYVLEDAESRNGTIVNGKPIRRVPLRDGDLIQVCGCKLRFSLAAQNSATESLPQPAATAEFEATVVSAPNPFMSSEGAHDLPPPPMEEDLSDLDPATMEIASSLGGEAPLHGPPSASAPVMAAPLFKAEAAGESIPPPPQHTEEIHIEDAFVAVPTEVSTPFAVAPAAAQTSTLPWFLGGLFMALITGGGAYAAMLFVNDGVLPGPSTAVATNTDPSSGTPTDPATGTPGAQPSGEPPVADDTPPANAAGQENAEEGAAGKPGEDAAATGEAPVEGTDPAGGEGAPAEDTDTEVDDAEVAAASPAKTPRKRNPRAGQTRKTSSHNEGSTSETPGKTASATKSTSSGGGAKWTAVNVTAAAGKSVPFKAPSAGKVSAIKQKSGAQVNKGQTIATLGGGDAQAIARLETSVQSLEEVVKGSGSEEAAVMLTQEKKRLAAARKGGGRVTAPISGTLASLDITVGQTVNAGQQVGIIDGRASTTVYATVPKTSAKPGSTVTLKLKSGGTVNGRVVNKTKVGRRYRVVIEPKGAGPTDIASAQLP